MRIGIDACTWSNRRGYGRFTRGVVTAMVEHHPEHRFVLVSDRDTARESRFPVGGEVVTVETRVQPTQAASADGSRSVADLWRMTRAVAALDVDVFFFPTNYSYFPLPQRLPTVLTVHDATAEQHPRLIFPDRRSRLFWGLKTRAALWQADRLVTVSGDAREQLVRTFRRSEAEITVIGEGADPGFRRRPAGESQPVRDRYGLPHEQPLVLYVGGISPHKNLDGLLHAMGLLDGRADGAWHLVLVGDHSDDSFWGCHQELAGLVRRLGLSERVTFTGFVPDEDLALLYNAATLLVLPSLSEGFGLPVVEAMASGLPVAVSDRNSLPEVVGSAGLSFDPLSPPSIAAAVGRLLDDEPLRRDLASRGVERAGDFSWRSSAETLLGLFEGLVNERPGQAVGNGART